MGTISFVFTLARVADILGEDEDWLQELSIGMFPEDGCLWVLDTKGREVAAFTDHGIKYLRQLIADEHAVSRSPKRKSKP